MKQRIACNIRTIGNMLIAFANRLDGSQNVTQTNVHTTISNTSNGFHIEIEIDHAKRLERIAQIESECDLSKIAALGRAARQQRKLEKA